MNYYTNFIWALTGQKQSMLVEKGRVVARGTDVRSEALATDLGGRYMLPGFIDCHCHVLPAGLDYGCLFLGDCSSHEEVLDALRDWHQSHPDGWLQAVHYNQSRYGNIHMSRDQLDTISADRPIVLEHVSGHASVANTAALVATGIDDSTPDPAGGTYVRDDAGHLTGLLLEDAHEVVNAAAPMATVEQMADAILLAGERMYADGITCASDMMTGVFDLEKELQAYTLAASRGCKIRVSLYVQWKTVFGPRGMGVEAFRERTKDLGGVKIGGIKLFADGALSSATAAIYGKFLGTPGGRRISRHSRPAKGPDGVEVSGQLIYSQERLTDMVLRAHEAGYQIATHSIGDFSTDLVMDAYEATGDPSRHRIEHAMMLSDAQIERLHGMNCGVTFQPEFLKRLAPSYLKQLPVERVATLERTRSALDGGIRLGFSSDRPVVAGNPWDGIIAASQRPHGFDRSENCTRLEALDLYTRGAAEMNEDDAEMGSLEAGQYADFQLYDVDPLATEDPRTSRSG